MAAQDDTTGLGQNDSRRRVARTPIVSGWNGGASVSQSLSDNVGLAQHHIWWNSTGATAGLMTIWVRPAKSGFWIPVVTIPLATAPTGSRYQQGIIDGVMLTVSGLTGTLALNAGVNSVGIDFTPNGNRSLVDRRRFQVMEVATGWNGAAAITTLTPDHQGYAQHQISIVGGVGTVKLQARPLGSGAFVDINSDVQALSAGGAMAIFPGMFDAFQLVPVGTVTGSINAQIISIGQEMFFQDTTWQLAGNFGNAFNLVYGFPQPANDALVVHLAGPETITGAKTFNMGLTFGAGVSINMPTSGILAAWGGGAEITTGASGNTLTVTTAASAADTLHVNNTAAATVAAVDQNGDLTLGYNTLSSDLTFSLNSAAATYRALAIKTAGVSRATIGCSSTAESGSNAGCDVVINRYSDAGAFLGTSFTHTRASGLTTLTTSGLTTTLALQDTGANGANLALLGNGATTPNKYIRCVGGVLQIVNSAYNTPLLYLNDFGASTSMQLQGGFYPTADNAYPVGQASARWSVIYAATGAINTSDQREKTAIVANTLGLDFVNALPVSQFKFITKHNEVTPVLDGNGNPVLDATGMAETTLVPTPGVRTHVGSMAQAVVTALQNAGIDPSTMGMWSLDVPADPTSRQGLRENELMWVLWTAVQQLSAKVVQAQTDIAAIKAKLGM